MARPGEHQEGSPWPPPSCPLNPLGTVGWGEALRPRHALVSWGQAPGLAFAALTEPKSLVTLQGAGTGGAQGGSGFSSGREGVQGLSPVSGCLFLRAVTGP